MFPSRRRSYLSLTFFFKTDIAQEKGQQQLREGIETFDPANLKHAETQEKNPLPTKEGTVYLLIEFNDIFIRSCLFFRQRSSKRSRTKISSISPHLSNGRWRGLEDMYSTILHCHTWFRVLPLVAQFGLLPLNTNLNYFFLLS